MVHVVAVGYNQAAGGLEGYLDGLLHNVMQSVRSLGYLGDPQDIMHLETEEEVKV